MSDRCKNSRIVLAIGVGVWLLLAGPARGQSEPIQKDLRLPGQRASLIGVERQLAEDAKRLLTADNEFVFEAADDQPLALDAYRLVSPRESLDLVARLVDPADETLGATLQPVGPVLREQLRIPAGRGVLVVSLRADSASARAGLKQNDILLSLADKPLATPEDLTKQLKSVGETPVPLKLLRAGKTITIEVRPVYRVTLGPAQEQKIEYYLGIAINPADDALRAQLGLPARQAVVITEVVKGSPAEKAGIKKHDIVLELAGKPIENPQNLARLVQTSRNHPIEVRLLRAGEPLTIRLTAAARKVEASPRQETYRLWLSSHQPLVPGDESNLERYPRVRSEAALRPPVTSEELKQRLDRLDKELQALRRIAGIERQLKDLHQELEQVKEALKAGKATKGN
jgi:hypothetical protein